MGLTLRELGVAGLDEDDNGITDGGSEMEGGDAARLLLPAWRGEVDGDADVDADSE